VLLNRGVCASSGNDTCTCFSNYEGYLCRTVSTEPVQSAQSTNWTVIVAVVSAIAGLLLIIALLMGIFHIIIRRRHRSQAR
jgi:uncharacterized membrane protein HdeD (DUF308 family)